MKIAEIVQISGKMIPGEWPIVRFRNDAARIQASLPPVPAGHIRLWRGNRPGEIGNAQSFTSDLPGIALPFREPYGGDISYVDVPQAQLPPASRGGAPGVEFYLPRELAQMARPVGVDIIR